MSVQPATKCECVRAFVCPSCRYERLCEHIGYSIGLPTTDDMRMLDWIVHLDQSVTEWIQSLIERSRGGRP